MMNNNPLQQQPGAMPQQQGQYNNQGYSPQPSMGYGGGMPQQQPQQYGGTPGDQVMFQNTAGGMQQPQYAQQAQIQKPQMNQQPQYDQQQFSPQGYSAPPPGAHQSPQPYSGGAAPNFQPSAPQPQYQQHQQSYANQPQYQQQSFAGRRSGAAMRPPFIDPNTQIIYDVDNPEYEGYLTKQSDWLKEWRRRYFILKGNKLFFGKNPHSAPHGMMDLAVCTTVKSADLKSKKRNSFEISTPETCYLLYADTEGEKDDWIGRVGKAIVRSSRTFEPGAANADDGEDEDDIYENDDENNPYYND